MLPRQFGPVVRSQFGASLATRPQFSARWGRYMPLWGLGNGPPQQSASATREGDLWAKGPMTTNGNLNGTSYAEARSTEAGGSSYYWPGHPPALGPRAGGFHTYGYHDFDTEITGRTLVHGGAALLVLPAKNSTNFGSTVSLMEGGTTGDPTYWYFRQTTSSHYTLGIWTGSYSTTSASAHGDPTNYTTVLASWGPQSYPYLAINGVIAARGLFNDTPNTGTTRLRYFNTNMEQAPIIMAAFFGTYIPEGEGSRLSAQPFDLFQSGVPSYSILPAAAGGGGGLPEYSHTVRKPLYLGTGRIKEGGLSDYIPHQPRVHRLDYSAGATFNWADVDIIDMTLAGNLSSITITGAVDGQSCLMRLKQDATGSRTITWPTNVRFNADITNVILSTTANKLDFIGLRYHQSDSKYDVVAFTKGAG